MKNDLIERYMQAIRPLLPRKAQDDILTELSENLRCEIEGKEEQLGRGLSKEELGDIIRKHGHPIVVAARYARSQYLIGPAVFPFYWLILRVAMGGALVVRTVLALVLAMTSADPVRAIVPNLFDVPGVLIPVFFWVTASFAALELCSSAFGFDVRQSWNPSALPAMLAKVNFAPRVESAAQVIFGSLAAMWWQILPHALYLAFGPAAAFLAPAPVWARLHWPILILILAGVVTGAVNLVKPHLSAIRVGIELTIKAYALVIGCLVLGAGTWLIVPAGFADPEGKYAHIVEILNRVLLPTFIALVVLLAVQLVWHSVKLLRKPLGSIGKALPFALLLTLVYPFAAGAEDGSAIYKTACAKCHDAPAGRTPPVSALHNMPAATILEALNNGAMKAQGASFSANERKAVAAYLSQVAEAPRATVNICPARTTSALSSSWSGWGANLTNSRYQIEPGMKPADVAKLEVKWAFPLGTGSGPRSQPAVAGGRVYVGGDGNAVYALDARTGCAYWTFHTPAPVRTAMVVGKAGDTLMVFFGDVQARLYAVNAATGQQIWKTHVDEHFAAMLTDAPALFNGVLYAGVSSYEEVLAGSPTYKCCTFRGNVVAINAATGAQIWKTYTIPDAGSGAGVWSTPTIDQQRNALYVATGDNYSAPTTNTSDAVLALDLATGKILWSRQATAGDIYNVGCDAGVKSNCPETHGNDFDFGQPPILVPLTGGKRALVIGQKSAIVYGFDPDREGAPLWQTRIGKGTALGGSQWGSASDGTRVYVALSDIGLKGVPDKSVPQGYHLEPDPLQGGGLFALDAATGKIVWNAKPAPCPSDAKICSPAQSAPVTAIPGAVFSGSVDGHLRAFDPTNGNVLWDFNTAAEFATPSGGKARGGSLDVAGPVVAGGMVFVTSGYSQWGGIAGDVLLAFAP